MLWLQDSEKLFSRGNGGEVGCTFALFIFGPSGGGDAVFSDRDTRPDRGVCCSSGAGCRLNAVLRLGHRCVAA